MNQSNPKNIYIIFILLFFLGAGVRAIDVWRPADGTVRESWRECDIAAVARNFYREGMNILYPRIDWRGDGPGYAEMEFPIYPWMIAALYKGFGVHEEIGRILAYLFSLLALVIFFRLARYLLSETAAAVASVFFVLSPLSVRISNALQPEALMILLYLSGVYFFILWVEHNDWIDYILALSSTAFAILVKATAAHIGLFYVITLVMVRGWNVFRMSRVWVFGILSLLPSLLWYLHGHSLWITYGNSLGVSNEYHWAGWDIFKNPSFILGIVRLDVRHVWMPTGMVFAVAGAYFMRREKTTRYTFYWLIAIVVYYLVIARTASSGWAYYYHVFAVAPVALIFGMGSSALLPVRKGNGYVISSIWLSVLFTTLIIGATYSGLFILQRAAKLILWIICSGTITLIVLRIWKHHESIFFLKGMARRLPIWGVFLLVFLFNGTFIYQSLRIASDVHPQHNQSLYECAKVFAPSIIPEGVLIVASGGPCYVAGHPTAYNASYMFYWTDHKGFNICVEAQSLETIEALRARGARFFIAERGKLALVPGFERDLRKEFNIVQECGDALLFDLTGKLYEKDLIVN